MCANGVIYPLLYLRYAFVNAIVGATVGAGVQCPLPCYLLTCSARHVRRQLRL